MNIRLDDSREQVISHLQEATGEATQSGALFVAARYFIQMRGDTVAVPRGNVRELLDFVDENHHVTVLDVVDHLETDELPIDYEGHSYSIGP